MAVSRGERNNNPLNLRIGNDWQGERKKKTDKYFEEFESIEWGLRAAMKVLDRYFRVYRLQTIPQIVTAWAPPHENATDRYISFVLAQTSASPSDRFTIDDKPSFFSLVRAMARAESGIVLDDETLESAYTLAFS